MDRIDLWVSVGNIDYKKLGDAGGTGEPSASIKTRVISAQKIQQERFKKLNRDIKYNSEMSVKDLGSFVKLKDPVRASG